MDIHQALDDMQQLKRTIEQQATVLFRAGALDPDNPELAAVAQMLARARSHAARTVVILAAALEGMPPRRDFLDASAAAYRALLQLQVLAYDLQAKGLPITPVLHDGRNVDMDDAGARLRWLAVVGQVVERLASPAAAFTPADYEDMARAADAGWLEWAALADGVRHLMVTADGGVVLTAARGKAH